MLEDVRHQRHLLSLASHYDFIDLTDPERIQTGVQAVLDDAAPVVALRINQDYSDWIDRLDTATPKSWRHYFKELFELDDTAARQYHFLLAQRDWGQVLGVHCRFLNLLGDKLEKRPEMPVVQQGVLLGKLVACLRQQLSLHDCESMLLCSDSDRFLNYIKSVPELSDRVLIIEGSPKHSEKSQIGDVELQKIVADFYLLSHCKVVVSIAKFGLYPSAFPKYAAMLADTPFHRLNESST